MLQATRLNLAGRGQRRAEGPLPGRIKIERDSCVDPDAAMIHDRQVNCNRTSPSTAPWITKAVSSKRTVRPDRTYPERNGLFHGRSVISCSIVCNHPYDK